MRVRVTQSFAEGWSSYVPGQEIEVPDGRAVELLRIGVVERIGVEPETATLPRRGEQAVRVTRPVR